MKFEYDEAGDSAAMLVRGESIPERHWSDPVQIVRVRRRRNIAAS